MDKAAPGDHYVVDLGKLVPVAATNPQDAYQLAVLGEFGKAPEVPLERPIVYRLDPEGEPIEVYCEEEAGS